MSRLSSKHSSTVSRAKQEEIAKQFELPERQSKIDTLLKEPEIYCICRTSDSTRFMIACDACEEWYHGDCVNVTQQEANNIHHYYCQWCMEKDPSLEIEYKKKAKEARGDKGHKGERSKGRKKADKSRKEKLEKRVKHKSPPEPPPMWTSRGGAFFSNPVDVEVKKEKEKPEKIKGCGNCSGCFNRRDCGRCDICKKNRKKDTGKKKLCVKRQCVEQQQALLPKKEDEKVLMSRQLFTAEDEDDEEDLWVPPPPVTVKESKKGTPKGSRRSRKKVETKGRKQPVFQMSDHSASSGEEEVEREEPRQCHWYECINFCRPGSKYCSDECGIRLATDRILRLLPGRIQEWNLTPSVAEENNKKDLEEIRRKQIICRSTIDELENKRIALDAHIEKIQGLDIDPNANVDDHEEEEGSIYCVTCGHEIPVKTCIKHMERCYNKYESQTSFGSSVKTGIEGTPIFCDFYHAVHRTYCKRLKVLCPEHCKDPKVRDTAICGYPLIQNVTGPTNQICRISKKKCNRHYCWEKMRRAEIDLEKVRYWLKLDALLDQERQCKQALTNRAGVLGLLLHSTFDHELREKIHRELVEQEMKEKEEDAPEDSEATASTSKAAAETVVKVEESSETEKKEEESPELNLNFESLERKEPSGKNREHRKGNKAASAAAAAAAAGAEEMTASKLFKKMAN